MKDSNEKKNKGTYTKWFYDYHHNKYWKKRQELYQEIKANPERYKELRERQVNHEFKYSRTAKGMFRRFKTMSKKQGTIMDFEVEQLQAILDGSCYFCGAEVNTIIKLTREQGIVLSNLVGYCQCCNKMKPVKIKEEEEV